MALVDIAKSKTLAATSISANPTRHLFPGNKRLRYLLTDKPKDISHRQWQELHQVISLYRRIIEEKDINSYENNASDFYSAEEVLDAIKCKLWQIEKVSKEIRSKISQKLAFDEFPKKIESIKHQNTLILEYFYGENRGACFDKKCGRHHDPAPGLPSLRRNRGEKPQCHCHCYQQHRLF